MNLYIGYTYNSGVFLSQEVTYFNHSASLRDGQVDGKVSVHWPHAVFETLL